MLLKPFLNLWLFIKYRLIKGDSKKSIKKGEVAERLNKLEKATGTNNKKATNGIANRLDDLESRIETLENA